MSTQTQNIQLIIEQLKHYCATQDRCKWDLIQKTKLLKLSKISTIQILNILVKEKYIDEERYSKSFCRGKFRIKKWGKIKITNMLKKKHISEININKGIQEINFSEYYEELENQYQKKKESIKEENPFMKKKKIAAYLIRKGYESNLVWNKLKD